jgi:hypothetical protein
MHATSIVSFAIDAFAAFSTVLAASRPAAPNRLTLPKKTRRSMSLLMLALLGTIVSEYLLTAAPLFPSFVQKQAWSHLTCGSAYPA